MPRIATMPRLLSAAVLFGLLSPAPASSQDWPTRPTTMVIPFSAAGSVDVVGRIIGARMAEILGKPVIIENIGGAGGMVGSARVAKAAPDGYQFVLGSVGTHAQNQTLYKKPLYNTATDFAPVALVAEQPIILAARNSMPVRTLPEFIAYAKENQAKMQYGSPGTGSSSHLACALLTAAIGTSKVTHLPYRTGGVVPDLIAGRLDYQCPTGAVAIPLVEANQAKMIATLTRDRWDRLPDLKTAHEQGLTNFDAYIWFALFLPRGTPAPIVQKLNATAIEAMNTPAVQARLRDAGATVVAPDRRSPEYLQKFVENEIAKWATPIKAAGIIGE
jgi:tripartite-type tricarboxylate transporter receptor subunit TctC